MIELSWRTRLFLLSKKYNKGNYMEEKKDIIYSSSKEALTKIFVLVLTFGISIFASLYDEKSCYITILVQACNNMYDFYQYTDNLKYIPMIKREAIAIILCSIVAIIIAIIGLHGVYIFVQIIYTKLFVILLVTLPLVVVYHDYKANVDKENIIGEK